MPLWNNSDREEAKPTWLNAAQKRFCVRTNAGWEIPVASAGMSNLADQFEGTKALGATSSYPQMELVVAMPNDPSSAGVASSLLASRLSITGSWTSGAMLAGQGITNYSPYITTPYQGDGATAGGMRGTGLSHSCTGGNSYPNFGLNEYGVSSLFWGTSGRGLTESVPAYTSVTGAAFAVGHTGYIKVKANDVNFTQNLTLTVTGQMTGGGQQTHSQLKRMTFVTGSGLLDPLGATGVPQAVYEAFFGPTSTYNNDIGVLILPSGLTTGAYGMTAYVNDGTTAASPSATGSAFFTVTVR